MKKIFPLTLAAAFAAPSAFSEININVGASSNYVWRGMSQTDNGPAVSAGIDYTHEMGFYAGTWTSNIDGGNETDLYFGYAGSAGDFEYGLGYIYYVYTQHEDSDFGEINADMSWKYLSAGVAYTTNDQKNNVTVDELGYVKGDTFYYLGVGGAIGDGWSAGATYGYYDFKNDGSEYDGASSSFGYVQLDVSKTIGHYGDFNWSLVKAEKESGSDDTQIVVGWSKSF